MISTFDKIRERLSPAHYGCGDYPAWLAHEAGQWTREQRAEREDRRTEGKT